MLQGIVMLIVSLPLLAAQHYETPQHLTVLDVIAIPVWLIGFTFEAVGDWQLMRFKQRASDDGVLNTGLWRYTRHPNYFGDAVQWWAFVLPALATGAWWSLLSPVIMTFLLLRVSGVAMLERSLKNRKPAYQEYIRRTSAFIPMPPEPPDRTD
jgi:steroid 5-alpha reductase family enzyme